ncbi:conserved hypothetical protein [Candidatus Sulfopaludibacter sp. SbA6]|nr:conserved hypothetical protein [Candidatus Sulfopaludibacter sp. SbA6]
MRKEIRATDGHRCTQIASLLLYLCSSVFIRGPLLLPVRADIIDRIAVSVGNRVITASDIEREIRVNSFLNGVKPDLSRASKRATAEKMVEQKLIQRELETSRYPQPDPAEIEPALADFKAAHFKDDAEYARSLADYGITDQDVRNELLWQRTLLRFIGIRFRPGVQVSDQDIQKYFDETVAPAARAAHPGEPVTLEDYRNQIEEKLTGDRADEEMGRWLKEASKRNEIVYHEEAFG